MSISNPSTQNHFSALDILLEDEEAADLLQAIRSWNLRCKTELSNPLRSIHHCKDDSDEYSPTLNCDNDKPTLFINTVLGQKKNDEEDEECTHMTDSDCTVSPCSTTKKISTRISPYKQALSLGTTSSMKGNYSAKPSSLTWRLLDPETFYTRHPCPIVELSDSLPPRSDSRTTHHDHDIASETVSTQNPPKDDIEYHHQDDGAFSQESALSILHAVSQVLGLDSQSELHMILPTIEKLVKVILNHVPHLEQFVHSVCQIILNQDSSIVTPHHDSVKLQQIPVFKAKKKDMDKALNILQQNMENYR